MELKSDLSSKNFHYIFLQRLVDYLEDNSNKDDTDDNNISISSTDTIELEASEACIDEEIKKWEKTLEDNNINAAGKKYSKGVRFSK